MPRKNGRATILTGPVVWKELLRTRPDGLLYRCGLKDGRTILVSVPR